MTTRPPYLSRAGLTIDPGLAAFLDDEVLPRVEVDAQAFWDGSRLELVARARPRAIANCWPNGPACRPRSTSGIARTPVI